MKLLYIAVLLAVMQASPPVPRQATDHTAGGSQNIQEHTTAKQAPSGSPIVTNPPTTTKDENPADKPTSTNAREAIVIREPVPVSVGKDWWDHVYIAFTGLLVLIGAIGVIAAFRTLKIIERQTSSIHHQAIQVRKQTHIFNRSAEAAQKAAEAALFNAQAVINSERPWLDVEPGSQNSHAAFKFFRVHNRGRTPAQFVSGAVDHVFVDSLDDLPIPPLYKSSFISPDETFLAPDRHFDIRPFFNPQAIIQNRSLEKTVFNPYQILIFYGQVIYEDVLTGATHETRWCYAWATDRGTLERTGPDGDGHKKYNCHT